MTILYLMIPITLLLGLSFVGLFFWANSHGNFDDLETPALRVLENDETNEIDLKEGVTENARQQT